MIDGPIVSSQEIVGLVGGASLPPSVFERFSAIVTNYIAADGGADHLLGGNITPVAVIGDLDSLSDLARATFASVVCHIPEQDTTDFEKALTRIKAPLILAVGFTGGRLDHSLAVLNVLARFPQSRVILWDEVDCCTIVPANGLVLNLRPGDRIALMPLSSCKVTASGLRWPLEDAAMHPAGMISSSNEVTEDRVTVYSQGPLLVTLPEQRLENVVQSLVPAK